MNKLNKIKDFFHYCFSDKEEKRIALCMLALCFMFIFVYLYLLNEEANNEARIEKIDRQISFYQNIAGLIQNKVDDSFERVEFTANHLERKILAETGRVAYIHYEAKKDSDFLRTRLYIDSSKNQLSPDVLDGYIFDFYVDKYHNLDIEEYGKKVKPAKLTNVFQSKIWSDIDLDYRFEDIQSKVMIRRKIAIIYESEKCGCFNNNIEALDQVKSIYIDSKLNGEKMSNAINKKIRELRSSL